MRMTPAPAGINPGRSSFIPRLPLCEPNPPSLRDVAVWAEKADVRSIPCRPQRSVPSGRHTVQHRPQAVIEQTLGGHTRIHMERISVCRRPDVTVRSRSLRSRLLSEVLHMRLRVPSPLAFTLLVTTLVVWNTGRAAAQTSLVPYYGKNNIHYDKFDWHHYETEHFVIYFYPELEKHLERMASYAESAYQQISADLRHELSTKIPLILFKTHSEFEQQNVAPGAAQEGVGAFAEPVRQRMVLPIDAPSDQLYGLIVHELTHQFEFDIIPTSLIRRS